MTNNRKIHILGIGNSILDLIIEVEEADLEVFALKKGAMKLCSSDLHENILKRFPEPRAIPGGSVANTISTLSAIQLKSSFLGLVGHDTWGILFKSALQEMGTNTELIGIAKDPTGKSLILITPDGERTMNTNLGSSQLLGLKHFESIELEKYSHVFIEGYLLSSDEAFSGIESILQCIDSGRCKVILTLSDADCVLQNHERFQKVIAHCDLVFANELEYRAMFGETDFLDMERTVKKFGLKEDTELVITRSEKGCLIYSQNATYPFSTEPVENPKDLTGAGDQFAAGYIYGYVKDWDIEQKAKFANYFAGKIIKQLGPRFELNEAHSKVDNYI